MRKANIARGISGTFASLLVAGTLLGVGPAASPEGRSVRSLFLNGIDISSARSQELKNVDVHINERGDVFIIAPHYQVQEEDTYVPLSKYVQGLNQPAHNAPGELKGGSAPVTAPTSPTNAPPASAPSSKPAAESAPKGPAKAPEAPPTAPEAELDTNSGPETAPANLTKKPGSKVDAPAAGD